MPYLIALEADKETIKVIKVLRVKFTPVTGIAKGAVMVHNNRHLLARQGDRHWTW